MQWRKLHKIPFVFFSGDTSEISPNGRVRGQTGAQSTEVPPSSLAPVLCPAAPSPRTHLPTWRLVWHSEVSLKCGRSSVCAMESIVSPVFFPAWWASISIPAACSLHLGIKKSPPRKGTAFSPTRKEYSIKGHRERVHTPSQKVKCKCRNTWRVCAAWPIARSMWSCTWATELGLSHLVFPKPGAQQKLGLGEVFWLIFTENRVSH